MAESNGTKPEVKQYERKCKNWLIDFGKWTLPRSEAPETFIFWTGLFTLAAVLKRRVFIPKRLLGSWSVAPNLYILFIAPAGRARKSTTANYTEELVDLIPSITKAPELITKEKLLERLVKSNDASMCVVSPEFGEFIAKSGPSMFGFLTNMYDGKKKIDEDTFSRGANFAEKPCINLLGATTPEWVAENMSEAVIGGGFASRVIFIYEERVRRRKLFYDDLNHDELDNIYRDLLSDLSHIAENISGEYELDDEAKGFMSNWYETTADEGDSASHKLSGYFERRPAHVLKVAMLLHAAKSDEMVLHREDFEQAIELVGQLEIKLPTVFQNVGKNPYIADIYHILDYITEKGEIHSEDVKRHFMHAATPSVLNDLLMGLAEAGYISVALKGMDSFYKPTGLQLEKPKKKLQTL